MFRSISPHQRWLRHTCQTRCLAHQLPLYRRMHLHREHLCSTRPIQCCSWTIFPICSLIQRSQLLTLLPLARACILLSSGRGRSPQTGNSQYLLPTPTAPAIYRDEGGAAQLTKDHLGHSCEHGACGTGNQPAEQVVRPPERLPTEDLRCVTAGARCHLPTRAKRESGTPEKCRKEH